MDAGPETGPHREWRMGNDPKDRRGGRGNRDSRYSLFIPDDEPVEGACIVPPVDIYETGDAFVVSAELPGIDRKDVRVEVVGSELTIRGERLFDTVCEPQSYYCLEGMRGRFCRKFTLPEEVRAEEMTVELRNGILKVTLPKSVPRVKPVSARNGK